MWFKWHLLNLGLKLKSISGGLKRTAVDEVNNVSKKDEVAIAGGQALHYERDVANRYYDFWDLDFSNMGRMNFYFFLIVAAIVTTIVRFSMGGMGQQVVSEDYLLMSAAGIGGLLLILFVFEIFRKKSDDLPVNEEEYNKAQEWMHAISEKARKSMPWWAVVIVGIGLVVEAGAISIIAASFVSDVSKNESMYIGIVLGMIVAAGLGWLIHQAGEGLYREHHRKRLHRVIRNEGGYESIKNDNGKIVDYVSDTYSTLKKDKNDFHTDGGEFFERHGKLIAAIIVIITLATLAFVQRAELNLDMIQDQQQTESTDILLSPDMSLMPSEVSNAQQNAQKNTVDEKVSHAEKGMYAALGILTLVFLIINGVGIMFGYKYCFYDDHSEKYYGMIKKYKEQASLRVKDVLYATLARQKVLKKSNQFFAKFQQHAVKQARREGLDSLQESFNERRAYKMETFVESQGRSV
ncbi:hypothetical protein JYT13_01025 [Mariprofundus ferrooxydans]|nr:hypothetical protein [Mariprofundus ferrooxydans]